MAAGKELSKPVSRRQLLAVGGGSTALAAFLAACGGGSSSTSGTTATGGGKSGGANETAEFDKGDVGILNYALTLEYLETAFYAEAKRRAKPSGEPRALADLIAKDEQEHVEALTGSAKEVLTAAGSIVQVEARHAAAIRLQDSEEPAPAGFDEPLGEKQVRKAVEPVIA